MCLARNFNEGNGDMFKVNRHFCMAARLNKSIVDQYNADKRREQETANNRVEATNKMIHADAGHFEPHSGRWLSKI